MPLPPWFDDKSDKKKQNRRSQRSERQLARGTGGRVTAGSGSSWRAPQDVSTDTHLIQHKYTDAKSYYIKESEWRGICADAARAGKEPAMVIDFERSGTRIIVTEG